MVTQKIPAVKAPWPPLPQNDKLFRYPKAYLVGKEKGESFFTIAKKHAVNGADLVFYNFRTRNSDEVNWYLANYVGCPTPRPGQKYFSFEGAVYDPKKNSGVIFIPMFGETTADYLNRLGEKVVENYNKSYSKEPGTRCYEACFARVREASKQIGGKLLPALDNESTFGRLWASYIKPKKTWLELPEEYRAKGAAGAIAWAGIGTIIDADGIWAGNLEPGAVIQTWRNAADFERVRDGDAPVSYGHSFIFLNYAYSGSGISGVVIADQGYQNRAPLVRGDYGFWVGANLSVSLSP